MSAAYPGSGMLYYNKHKYWIRLDKENLQNDTCPLGVPNSTENTSHKMKAAPRTGQITAEMKGCLFTTRIGSSTSLES